jgi:hypothetical protein
MGVNTLDRLNDLLVSIQEEEAESRKGLYGGQEDDKEGREIQWLMSGFNLQSERGYDKDESTEGSREPAKYRTWGRGSGAGPSWSRMSLCMNHG